MGRPFGLCSLAVGVRAAQRARSKSMAL
jgi:hypothetical protein